MNSSNILEKNIRYILDIIIILYNNILDILDIILEKY